MNYAILPYINAHDLTAQTLSDLCAQSLPTRTLCIANGGDVLPDPRALHWRYTPALSLAAVWNRGLQFCWEAGAEYALVVNNDVRLPRTLLETLKQVQQLTGAWFVTATNQSGNAWYDAMMGHRMLIDDDFLRSRGGPDFSCFLITKECHAQFRFDENFSPAYCEDVDYHRRLMLAGHGGKIFSVCQPYLHYGSGTLNSLSTAQRAKKEQQIQGSRDYYTRKWGGPPNREIWYTPFNSPRIEGISEPYAGKPPCGPTTPELLQWVQGA